MGLEFTPFAIPQESVIRLTEVLSKYRPLAGMETVRG
jgi:hypothetical protein